MELRQGSVVRSVAGRDKGRLLYVVENRGDRILVCDGKERPLSRPKSKNPRHLRAVPCSLDAGQTQTDRALRKALVRFENECDARP